MMTYTIDRKLIDQAADVVKTLADEKDRALLNLMLNTLNLALDDVMHANERAQDFAAGVRNLCRIAKVKP